MWTTEYLGTKATYLVGISNGCVIGAISNQLLVVLPMSLRPSPSPSPSQFAARVIPRLVFALVGSSIPQGQK